MDKMIFVNLPVADVVEATAFDEALGFEKNEMFFHAQASAMVCSDNQRAWEPMFIDLSTAANAPMV